MALKEAEVFTKVSIEQRRRGNVYSSRGIENQYRKTSKGGKEERSRGKSQKREEQSKAAELKESQGGSEGGNF